MALGKDYIIVCDQSGNCYSWGSNQNKQLGLVENEDDSFNQFENYPKKIDIFSGFDVLNVFSGVDFVIIRVKPWSNENLVEHSVHYYHTNKSQTNNEMG